MFFIIIRPPPLSSLFPYTTLFRSFGVPIESLVVPSVAAVACLGAIRLVPFGLWLVPALGVTWLLDRKSTRLNSSHVEISYAVFCLKKKSERTSIVTQSLTV